MSNSAGKQTGDHFSDYRATVEGWHMFTVAWSRPENQIVFYVDGRRQKSGPLDIWPERVVDNFAIGTWSEGTDPQYYVQGHVGRVRCYNRMLSAAEVGNMLQLTQPQGA